MKAGARPIVLPPSTPGFTCFDHDTPFHVDTDTPLDAWAAHRKTEHGERVDTLNVLARWNASQGRKGG